MAKQPIIQPFSEEKQKQYEREARLEYGPENVNTSIKRWNSYTQAQRDAIMEEGGQNYLDMVKAMEAGETPDSAEVQVIVKRWHDHIHYFYEPTIDILSGLGETYRSNPEFAAFFANFHPDLPEYLSAAIRVYVDEMETAAITHLLADDEAGRLNS